MNTSTFLLPEGCNAILGKTQLTSKRFPSLFTKVATYILAAFLMFSGLAISNSSQAQTTVTYSYTGANQTFTVPAGVTSIAVKIWGAGGGGNGGGPSAGGSGAFLKGTLAVTPGQTLAVVVGGGGNYSSSAQVAGSFGGGGASGSADGSSGGGYSGIFNTSVSFANALAISGAGAGGGYFDNTTYGGAGGATTGSAGGTAATGYTGGSGGTISAGGAGGLFNGSATVRSTAGTALTGGTPGTTYSYGGSGGGGGYYGGGSGYSSSNSTYYGSGGGGGSSYLGTLTATTNTAGVTSTTAATGPQAPGSAEAGYVAGVGNGGSSGTTAGGNGLVTITYTFVCTPPTTQAAIGSYTNNTTGTTLTANWTRGNGAGVIVVARLTSTTAVAPTGGTTYTANAAFGSGATTGTGNYVVYNGTGTSVNVTGLTLSSNYTFTVYEYSGTSCYLTPGSSSAVTATFVCTPPTTQASIGAYTNNAGTTLTANWTRGNGSGVVVVARLTSTSAVDPSNASTYTANAAFGSGSTTGTGNYVVYNGTGTSVNVTGLAASTGYTFTVYEYSGTNCYLTPGSSSAVTTSAVYCTTGLYTTGCSFSTPDEINNLTISNLSHLASGCSGGTAGYGDFTVAQPTINLTQGTTYTYTITCPATGEYVGVWIDLNDNKSFTDAGEFIGGTSSSSTGTTITGTVTVPAGAALGNHRIRFRVVYNTIQSLTTACTSYTYGEIHDYTCNITAPLPAITGISPISACVGQSVTITGTNFTSPITSVTFGGVAATTFAYVSATSITATVPAGAASGAIVVTQASGSGTSSILFGVTSIPAPTATNGGTICSGSTATLTASGLTPGGTVASFTGTNGTSASITAVSNNFTMDFWVKPSTTITLNAQATSGTAGLTGQQYAVAPTQSATNGGVGVSVGTNGLSVYEHGNGYISPLLTYTFPATITTFIHVAVVYTSRTPSLYINGSKVATGLTSVFGTNSYPSIGSDGPGGNNYGPFTGLLDDYRAWNGSLTQAEIVSIMFNQNGTTSKTKLAQYTFNNSTVTDGAGSNPNWNTPSSFVAPNYFTYTWTGTNAPAASTAETQTTGVLTASQSYTVVATVGGSCPSPASAATTVTVNQKSADPTSATASATTICNGDATSLILNGGGGGTGELIKWYTVSCGGTLAGTGNNLSVSPAITTTYYGRYEDGAPCTYNSLCASVTITVNQKSSNPTSASASPTTICNGGSSSLTLNGGGGGTGELIKWYTGSCGGTLAGTGNGLSVSPTVTTTYYGRYEDGAPCNYNSLCSSVTITVNQKSANPTSASASATTICNGGTTILTLNGGGGGTGEVIKWYTVSCGGTLAGTGNNLSVSPTITTTYYGRYEDAAPCSYNSLCSSVTITVNQKSANPTSATASATTICNGDATILTLNGGGGGTGEVIKWYTGSCGGTLAGTGNGLSVSPTVTTTYFGRYEDGAPCNYNSLCSSVTITVNQKSADPTSATASATTICNGNTTTLTLNGGGGGTGEVIHWYSGSCGGTAIGTGNNLSVSPSTTTTYYGRYEDGAPCNYNSLCSSVTITVNQKSADPTSATASSTSICNGDATTLTLNGGGGGTGETIHWYSGSCGGTAVGTGNNLSVSPTVTTTYYGRYEDGAPCNYNSLCASVTITVNPNYTITASAGANGSVSPSGVTTLTCNGTGSQTYTITPAACYSISDVLVDGVSVGAVGTYTFTNVTANHTISATFAINTYTITATSGANGTVTPAGATTVNCGANQTYTITPDACYSIADVLVDGVSVGAIGTYTFNNVTANHTISATFVINGPYTISASSGANGTVTPAGTSTVACGSNNTYTITPDACYSIADVLVDGVSVGAVATYTFNNVTANHTISATFAITTYTATINAGANGSITPGSATVNCGSNNTYTITPDACYHITDVTLNGVSQGAVSTLNVNNVQANYTVAATFAINTYTITATSGANGSVTPAGATTVNCGANQTYTITPDACYSIADVLVDGVSVGAVGTYTFTNVTASHTISATFVINGPYTITASSGANGTVTPAGTSTVACGSNNTYTITPDACYSIADVLVDGVSVGAVGTYTFTNVTANHTISATFAITTYTATINAGANGSITPGSSTVNCGSNNTYTITPDACYHITDVTLNGVSQGAVSTLNVNNVQANYTVAATFAINTFTITATSGANGTVTPAGATTVNCGANQAYTITPDACYSIADVLVDGVSVGAVGTYTFTNVTTSHTISATFSLNTYTITATSGANGSVTPAGASVVNCGDNLTYTITADPGYAIADVLVDGSSVGAVGTYTFTNITANHTISASFVLNNFTITSSAGANGTISPNGATSVASGANQTYTITPDACYSIADVLVDGLSVGAVGTYTFTNVTANHTISATFSLNTYTITATSGANGTVTPAGATTVNCGANQAYTITPDACYSIADVLVDGVSVGAVGTYTFNNVTTNHTISATFSLNTYTITATSGANGTVTPAGATTVNCGANQTYTITPDACYSIADVLVDGVSVGAVGTYTFTNVTASHTISATFSLNTFTITATSGANGTVTPAGATTVNCGANQSYTITPDACYSIADVLVDGVSVGAVGTYSFTNVTASHTISATFSLNTFTITATSGANGTVTPAGATTVNCGANQTYTITPDACYSIADVLVDGVSVGAVGTYSFTNVTASHTISATFLLNTFTITATSGANGTVTPAGATTVNCGANQTYTITPDACYSIADVLVDGVSVGAVGTYTFTNVTASHTISATFSLNTYTITATSGANGTVTPAGATTVNCGANQAYTITPDACYSIADVLVDGVSVGAVGTYTFTNVTASHTISATFSLNTFTITATSGANGTVTPAGATTVNCGANQTYTITPDACYSIADVLVDGVSVGAVGTYTFTNVTASHTISATFSLNTYTITATSGANGTVTPAGATTVNCGANQTYTITPDACYSIADVLVDGVSVGAVGTYTFTNVTASHTISATFSLNTFTITATSGANGTVTPAGATTVNCGANQTYTITPDACYSIADVLVDGVSVGAVGTYTFTNVTASHTISATFSLNTYTITATSGANGTVTPAGATTVNCGANQAYTITPDACYSIADVLVDGVSVGAVGTYTFNNVTTNHTISATFSLNTYMITATSGANGTVTPAGATTVNCGANQTYTITPDACYSIADVLVDGVSVGAVGTYTFTNVTTNHTISATFSLNTYTITATSGANGTVTPAGATTVNCGANQTYTITPDACYSIADVLVDGVSVGAVGTYTFTNVTASHTISATFSLNTFTITATSGANGTVTPAGATTVNCGANQAYTITPDACYSIADVLVDGVSVGAVGTYTFTNVTASHTISATFSLNTFTITATSGANGTVTPAGATTVNCGANQTYTITPDACYSIADVLVDGVSVGAVGTYTFTNVTASHTISATFSLNTFTITATSGANGTVTPAGATTVNCGANQTYTITPDACYSIADVLVDGVSVGAVGTYTFNNVTTNHTISATFSLNTYTITATSGANGTVTPAGATTVNCGANQTYTITPDACYSIADVLVDGVSVGAVGTYTFTNVTASHTISATFSLNTYTITATSGANGTVTPAGATTVNCGTNQTYTITPAACYSIADVLVDGVSVGAVGTYTFTNVTASHTISATFSLNTFTITATSGANGTVTPAGATTVNCGANQTYTITPDACYSISDVLVDGVSVGAVGTYTFTNVTASHTISATFSLNTYTITATSGANGTVTPAGATTVNCGANQTYTITPDACYSIADVLVDGVSVGAVGTYTFTNVTTNHTISATFSLNTYTITATSGANGTVTPAGATTVNCGANQAYTITPDACYSIADVLVDGVSVGAVGTYTFNNVTTNHTISATFSLNTYMITATSGANGTVTPAGATTVNCGANQTYTITPDACYSIADVLVDGVSVGAVGTYTFTNVTTNHTISATFSLNTYTITATSGANGTVTPAGATTVNCGANQTYTITPDACYSIADVLVDGVSVGAVGTYTFTNVTASHTISATFSLNTFTITATSGANGTVTPAGATTVNCGANQAYTITPDACYSIADVLVDGVSVGAVGTYTFTNVTASHTISATFSLNTFTITATSGANGTVTPAGATTVNCGANQTYTITPDACYSIADVLVDGVSVGAVGTYTFTNVTASHTISATFSLNTFTITATSGANGTVTPAGATTVNCGANQTYTITPDACYSIADVLVDGVSVGAVGTYTFNNVTTNHTISATFSLNTYTITATSGTNGTVTPAGATTVNCGANQTYTITPDACYSIADVLVDGVSVGAVGTYTFTNVTASHTISATFSLNTYTITATSGANGTVTPAGATTVNCGTNQTYTITPDACYSIADVLVDGVSVGAVGTYTFTNVTANHTISATFSLNTYTITATSGANGTVTPAGATTVNCGANQAYTITPDACYSIADVLVDGVSVGAVGTYTFTNVTTNHTISATFSLNTFTITATSGANGTVTPAGATTVNCGANQTYTITPAACYSIADVLVDGVSVGAVGTYTFNNVTTNHTISATFSLNTYTITATSGANGTVTPAGATTVNCGANQTYTITPDACYSIADVLVDGVSVGAVGTYTFTNVTASHTISATFSLNTYTITATSGANGSVTPAGATTVNCGANQTYTITPDACYSIADVLVDGVSVGAVGTYTFTNVTASHTISATFSLNTYTITATSGANGTVTPSGATTVNCGANQTYTITPNACYSIADVLVDGVSVGAVGTYTFTNVTASHTISATFSLNTFTITATSGANGTVTPAGATTVNCGANQAYTITPDACYSIADVLVDGVSVGAVGTYTFTNVTASHTISATFSLNTFTITATSGANGTVTPAGATTVNCGANQTYTVTPAACYSIADVLVDGVSVGAVGTYTFTNVTASHTISATFSLNTFTITATSGANGTVTPAGATTVNCGANQAYTITPAACYSIANVLVDGVSVGAVGAYTFTNVTASHTISASFVAATYTINASAGAGGTITPSGAATVACGGNATYTIAANNCYSITNVVVDGISQGAVSTYTFTNVTANHTISATFTQNTYIITVSAGTGGTVTPGTGAVNCGSNATYTITAAACNHIVDVLVDGVSQGAVSTYTFTNITAAHTISATFTGNAAPATPTVTGPVNVCTYIGTGAQVTYTATSAGATGFTWVIPPTNVAIVTGQGTANLTVTFQNGFAAQGNKQLRVTATSACGNSSQTLYVLVAQTPGTPGPITGNTNVCPIIGTAATYTYTINSVLAASSYIWTVPSGATIVSHPAGTGANDTVITVSFSGSFVNNTSITVASANNCNPGGSAVRSLAISRPAPATPGLISGPGDACPYMAPNGTPATYSIAAVAGAVSYTWTVPGGVTITGQGTTSISFTYASNFTSGSVTVTATNGCGTSAARSLGVSKYQPAAPSNIDVILVSDCPNRVYTYSIATTPLNSTSVQWTIPSGGTIVSGQGTTSITVSYAGTSISGNVTVQAVNNCSASTIRTVVVRLPACAGGRSATYTYTKGTLNTSTPMEVKVFPNPSVSDFKLEVLTAGKETIYVRILDMEGREYRKLTVLPYQTATLGSDLKPGSYMIEVKQGEAVKATRLIKF